MYPIIIRLCVLFFSISSCLTAASRVYLGSFDPPTEEELFPIRAALQSRSGDQLIIMVDRHPASSVVYRHSAQERIERLRLSLQPLQQGRILFLAEPWCGASSLFSNLQPLLREELIVCDLRHKESGKNKCCNLDERDCRDVADRDDSIACSGRGAICDRSVIAARSNCSSYSCPVPKGGSTDKRGWKEDRSILQIKSALHQESFASYVREAAAHFPELSLFDLSLPPFDSKMSNFARVEQFIATALKVKRVSAKQSSALGKKSEKLLLSTERDRLYPKMHCLQEIRREPRHSQPLNHPICASTFTLPATQLQEGHTLDVEAYCADRFAHALFTDGLIGEANTYFHMGSTEEAIDFHEADGYTEQYEIFTKAVKKLRVNLLVRNPATHKVRLVICNMYGEDTLQHVALQFSQTSHFHHVTLIRHSDPIPFFELDPQFQNIEFAPSDLLIIGFKNAIGRLLQHKPEWKKQLYSSAGLSIDCYEHAVTKERVILSKCVFGDQLTELLHHFYAKGVRRFQYFGTSGSLSSNLHVGDVVTPSQVYAEGKVISFENRAALLLADAKNSRLKFGTMHGWVQSPMLETFSFLKRLQEGGVESLDVEARYYAQFFHAHSDATAGLTLFISDEPFGNITLDQFNTMDHYIDEAFSSVCGRLLPWIHYETEELMRQWREPVSDRWCGRRFK